MTLYRTAGLASAALAVSVAINPASAADLGGYGGKGSIKDAIPHHAPAYHAPRGPAGNCYFRGDLGYSVSRDPGVKWAVSNTTNTYTTPGDGSGTPTAADVLGSSVSTYVGDTVTETSLENAWMGGVGLGCGMGSSGFRGEVMLGYTGNRKLDGTPLDYTITNVFTAPSPAPTPVDDPLHSSIKSHTLLVNVYKDLGNYRGIVPYIGAGVGVAYNKMSEVYFTGNPLLTNRIEGESKLSLAWNVMAGIGWQVSDRAILDFGYRFMDYGKAQSGRVDSAGFVNPRVFVDDIRAHEFKVGLRYHFGGSDCCAQVAYQPMK